MNPRIIALASVASLLLLNNPYKALNAQGCYQYPVTVYGGWSVPKCPQCVSTNNFYSACWGPGDYNQSCTTTNINVFLWRNGLCVAGNCPPSSFSYDPYDYAPLYVAGPACNAGGGGGNQ